MNELIPILPHFWASDYQSLEDFSWIKKKKITIVIHLSKNRPFIGKGNFEEIRIPVYYNDEMNLEDVNNIIYNYLSDTTAYIYDKIGSQENILLVGEEGKEDIDIFLACYFIRYARVFPNIAVQYVKSKKKNAFLDKSIFIPSLNKFYYEVHKNFSA